MTILATRDATTEVAKTCQLNQVDAAAASVLEYFFPLETPGRLQAKAQLLRQPVNGCDMSPSHKYAVAAIERARLDGAFPPRKLRSNPRPYTGEWRPTPPLYGNTPTEPYAGEWRMYFAQSPTQYVLSGPPGPDTPAYRHATNEVLAVRAALSPDQVRLAETWNLDAGSVTPPGVWNLRLRAMLRNSAEGHDTLRIFAVLNAGMYDAMVACWHYKFTFWTERPITAVNRMGLGELQPWLVTPSFPSYPSGHATVSGAAERVISLYVPGLASEARRMAREAADSRLWGGIHFAFDNDDGLSLGWQVGEAAVRAMPPRAMSTH